MKQNQPPIWQQQVEEILRKKFQDDDLADWLKRAHELGELVREVEAPTGDIGEVVGVILKLASEELYPLAAVYASFRLGVAYERYQKDAR